jgi:hypothetical protein
MLEGGRLSRGALAQLEDVQFHLVGRHLSMASHSTKDVPVLALDITAEGSRKAPAHD